MAHIFVHLLIAAPVAGGEGWDQTVAPVAVEGVAAPVPSGWDAAPAAQGWE